MKHSIYKVFKNLNLLVLISFITALILFSFVVEQYYSYKKINILQTQKAILTQIVLSKEKIKIIDFNSNIATINNAIEKLKNQSQYNFISLYITKNEYDFTKSINTVQVSLLEFDTKAKQLFKKQDNEPLFIPKSLRSQPRKTISLLNRIIIKNIAHDNDRFELFSRLFLFLLLLLFTNTVWQRKKLNTVYENISFLYTSPSKDKKRVHFQEIHSINMKMKRKNQIADNPNMLDPVTNINNNKGMYQAYSKLQNSNDNNFTSLAILEIDNFSKFKHTFSQEFIDDIFKKVAYTISLHEHSGDVIARTEYKQFTLIFSRPIKEQLFKDIELIRQSIADIHLASSTTKEVVKITVSGGFIIKPNHSPLEESIKKAKTLLENAKNTGTNKILQVKDIPKI